MSTTLSSRYLSTVGAAVVIAQVVQQILPFVLGHTAGGLVGMLLTIGAVLLAVLSLAKADSALIGQMVQVVQKIERNETPQPLPATRTDELGLLASGINKLTNRDKAVQQANTDALTGLANRRGLLQKLEYAFKRKQPLALFYIDLDKFKPINDQYGHEMGDAVLKKVSELFLASIRENDLAARLGGDEFVLVMFDLTDKALLTERAAKILATISEPMWVNDVRVKIGGSIGITVAPTDGDTVEALMAAADETMYAVKKGGRNNFKFYS